MPRVRDILYRFRPSAAPGKATATGVPADRERDLATELDPVFAALADTVRECADIVERARLEAARTAAEAHDRAESMRAAGRARVVAERAAAASAVRRARSAELSEASQAVDRSIARLREHSERLLPAYVEAGVGSVRAMVGADLEDDPGHDPGGVSR